jgi:hypothetical protein
LVLATRILVHAPPRRLGNVDGAHPAEMLIDLPLIAPLKTHRNGRAHRPIYSF